MTEADDAHLRARRAHAIRRARERYGLALTIDVIHELESEIGLKRSILLARETDGSERHMVRHGDVKMIAVWRPDLCQIVTFLDSQRIKRGKLFRGGRRT